MGVVRTSKSRHRAEILKMNAQSCRSRCEVVPVLRFWMISLLKLPTLTARRDPEKNDISATCPQGQYVGIDFTDLAGKRGPGRKAMVLIVAAISLGCVLAQPLGLVRIR